MQITEEWKIVEFLMDRRKNMFDNQKKFIESLYDNLDPHEPFLNQQSKKQHKYLIELHKIYK